MIMYMLIVGLTFILLSLVCLISFVLMELSLLITREEKSSYECGFEHNSLSRLPFSIRYFLLTVIFLVFDVEVMLLTFVPSFISYCFSPFNFLVVFFFVLVLFFGLIYEWLDGSLEWVM